MGWPSKIGAPPSGGDNGNGASIWERAFEKGGSVGLALRAFEDGDRNGAAP